ncbi:MAG: VanZ family protein [bacterium]|nr:VanZ family protein [bacterium]
MIQGVQNRTNIVLAILALLAGVYLLDGVEIPAQSRLWREFTNAGHAPLFGVLSIAVLVLTRACFNSWKSPKSYYLFAGITTAGLGFTTEVIQYFTPRDASALDMVYNLIGIVSFLVFAATFDRGLRVVSPLSRLRYRIIARLGSLVILSTAFIAFAVIASAHAHRKTQFPVILDFESFLDKSFLEASNAMIDFVQAPRTWTLNAGSKVCWWAIQPGKLSSITVKYPNPVWAGYDHLEFQIYSEMTEAVSVSLRINDVQHNFDFEDRYNTELRVEPGLNFVSIPLLDVENAPRGRKMDMTSIANIIMFTTVKDSLVALYIDNIRLR